MQECHSERSQGRWTLGEIAEHVGARLTGDPATIVRAANTLGNAREGDISFLANRKYEKQLETTKASAVLVRRQVESAKVALLVSEDPYYAFMQVMVLLHGYRKHSQAGVSPRASIHETATIGRDCQIYDFATVAAHARIGDGCVIYPCAYIGEGTVVGDHCIIYPNVTIYDGCQVGSRVTIHASSTIGVDGFGYATHKGEHHKIPQVGRVIIEDDVEIGSACGIERGTLDDTVIGKGTKLADLVAIGHGTKVGAHCLLVSQVGIAGSTTLGHHCVIGGQITVGNCVTIGAQAGVVNNIPDGVTVLGAPAIDANQARRAYTVLQHLPEMRQDIRRIQKKLRKDSPAAQEQGPTEEND
jgi:UDP-3-O-[3-hydroxymyristoyl] glucosamine N-acyltransferase